MSEHLGPDLPTSEPQDELANQPNDSLDVRRRTLMRLGVYGAVTAPVLLGLLRSEKAIAQSGEIPGIPGLPIDGGGSIVGTPHGVF